MKKDPAMKMKKAPMKKDDAGLRALAKSNPNLVYKEAMNKLKKSMAKLMKDDKAAMKLKKQGAMMMKKASAAMMKNKKSMATMKKKSAMMMKKMSAAKMGHKKK